MTADAALSRSAANTRRARMVGDRADGLRQKDDFYPTPPAATKALLAVEEFNGPIWEPACGDGAISKVLAANGHEVVSTELFDRGFGETGIDFLFEFKPRAPNIVTNPPFKLANQFVRKALDLTTGKVAFLARITFLEGLERRRLFESTPLSAVHIFSKRLTFVHPETGQGTHGGGMLAFAWFVWDHAHKGKPEIGWL